jgi:uncharacterized protein (TIGR00290 family)
MKGFCAGMDDYSGKKFIAAYSGGKDSTFAAYKAIQQGLVPLELFTLFRTDEKRSWFHGLGEGLFRKVSASIEIPIKLVKTAGEQYEKNFEQALAEAKSRGAEVCVFGDIDIQGHLDWCTARCEKIGLIPYFPLWKMERKHVVFGFIDAGFKTMITLIDSSRMPQDLLGQTLSRQVAERIELFGADICGENGEYHSFVYDGPIFLSEIEVTVSEKVEKDKYIYLVIE